MEVFRDAIKWISCVGINRILHHFHVAITAIILPTQDHKYFLEVQKWKKLKMAI